MSIQGQDLSRVNDRIDNIPSSGTLTGFYDADYNGCWWEYVLDEPIDGHEVAWIIGDYPDHLIND